MTQSYVGTNNSDYKAASKTGLWGLLWESWNMDGRGGNDWLVGGEKNDILNGGTGVDRLEGRGGNDRYYVDETQDAVIEASGKGNDTVYSSAWSYTLSANVEQLMLIGTAFEGNGNSLSNRIEGNNYANRLHGWSGNDKIYGFGGNDFIFGGTGADTLDGGSGNDTLRSYNDTNSSYGDDASTDYLFGGVGNDYLVAGNGADRLFGDQDEAGYLATGRASSNVVGNDTLVSGTDIFADQLFGGKGNDTYILRAPGAAQIVESVGEGIDTVRIEYAHNGLTTLASNVENLELIGNTATASGNDLDNVIKGNALNNSLSGKKGNDTLLGEAGRDTLYGGDGSDNLNGGDHDDVLYGHGQGDILVGEAGNDKLVGFGWSNNEVDSLIGNSGADTFVIGDYNEAHYVGFGDSYAIIYDFSRAAGDKIQIHYNGRNNYTIGVGYFANAGSSTKADAMIQYNGDVVAVVADNTTITAADFAFGN